MQKILNINIKDYEEYTKIEIEIIPDEFKYGDFINRTSEDYHIYFNDCKEEIKRNYTFQSESYIRIKIILDPQVKSLSNLFCDCEAIKSINFKKFYKSNITNMCNMFRGCSSLDELNISNFNTNKVNNRSNMFSGCSSLKELKILILILVM